MIGRRVLGIDAGNTKTIALLASLDGTIVGSGRVMGTADIHATSEAIALEQIGAAADEAGAADPNLELHAVAVSAAGADWPEDVDLLREALARRWPPVEVVNDAIGALRASVPHGPGVVIACGTGAATGARDGEGRQWHSSFWQEPQGAHGLGVQTLLAVIRAELGIDPPTALTTGTLAALDEAEVEAVIHRWTRRDRRGRFDPAILATVLLDAAEAGDATATAIVERQGAALGATALAAARKVGISGGRYPLALVGGVFRHPGRRLADAIAAAVRAGSPDVEVIRPTLEPAVGALLMAFDLAGIEVTRQVDANLRASLPPADLFDTRPRPAAALDAG